MIHHRNPPAPVPDAHAPVTMLELFFDLVFVFTVTQVTALILASPDAVGYGRAALVLFLIFWSYDAFAYLSNNIPPTDARSSAPLQLAMVGFLVMAIAVPDAFGADAWIFAVAYLAVIVIHGLAFTRSAMGQSALAIRAILPFNVGAGLLLLVAAAVGPEYGWIAWVAAVVLLLGSVIPRGQAAFALRPEHFAERHRLVLIIALGETIIAIGVSARGDLHHPPVLLTVLAAFALVSALFWVQFGFGDGRRAVEAMERVGREDPRRLARLALWAFAAPYLVLVASLVLVAVALHDVVHSPSEALSWRVAITFGAGVAVYLLGHAFYLRLLRLRSSLALKVGAAAGLLTAAVGVAVSGLAQLGALFVVVVVTLLVAARTAHPGRRGEPGYAIGSPDR
ncbi:MAG TPA: low temperature requirement protein A [Candidatus Nanopelagicales bacterium]|nr:low temperature requirement protein A [Candidatus Nanopelagicales bacterium]